MGGDDSPCKPLSCKFHACATGSYGCAPYRGGTLGFHVFTPDRTGGEKVARAPRQRNGNAHCTLTVRRAFAWSPPRWRIALRQSAFRTQEGGRARGTCQARGRSGLLFTGHGRAGAGRGETGGVEIFAALIVLVLQDSRATRRRGCRSDCAGVERRGARAAGQRLGQYPAPQPARCRQLQTQHMGQGRRNVRVAHGQGVVEASRGRCRAFSSP